MALSLPYRFGTATSPTKLFFSQLDADLLYLLGHSRQILTANTTYNVPSDFATIQAALDYIAADVDLGGFDLTVQLASGTYAGFTCPLFTGAGTVKVKGDETTPSNVTVNTAVAVGAVGGRHCHLRVGGITFSSTTSINDRAQFTVDGACRYTLASAGASQIVITRAAHYRLNANVTISGNCAAHYDIRQSGQITWIGTLTITFSGTPAYSNAFVVSDMNGTMGLPGGTGITFSPTSAAFTGRRYNLIGGSRIASRGSGVAFFPSATAGDVDQWSSYL